MSTRTRSERPVRGMTRTVPTATRGLTLLEVLAAVVVVGITYVVVFFPALSESLQREGENKRRIRATLLADEALAAVEANVERGLVPRRGVEENEVDEFIVEVETQSMDFALAEPSEGSPLARGRNSPDRGGLLGTPERPDSSALRRIDVRVRWVEGFADREVGRTTFAFDPAGAQGVLQSLIDAAAAGSLGGPAEDGSAEGVEE